MDATIAICTWNRSDLLDKTLAADAASWRFLRGSSWEIVVVNNRCTDNTDEILAKHSGPLPVRRHLRGEAGAIARPQCRGSWRPAAS